MRTLHLILIFNIAILSCVPKIKPTRFERMPEIRVLLAQGEETITINATQDFTISSGNNLISKIPGKTALSITRYGKITFGTQKFEELSFPLQIRPSGDGFLIFGDRTYRGRIEVRQDNEKKLTVINILPIEEYLFSVVFCEIGGEINNKTYEAAKAQAIAARSYALSRFGAFQSLGFDVFATYLRDQEYRGKNSESELTTRAVLETRGIVATFNNQVIEAKYSSTCGGISLSGKKPYLKNHYDTPGHRPRKRPFCYNSPHYNWKEVLSRVKFEGILSRIITRPIPQKGKKSVVMKELKLKSIKLEINRKTKRVSALRIATNQGKFRIKSEVFRSGFTLKSNRYNVQIKRNRVVITGSGYGHGIGLCQYGSLEMARRGYSYSAIIKHYYPKTKLSKLY